MNVPNCYPSKLLLFGEYTVIDGSRALALPLDLWHGRWDTGESDYDADPLLAYLRKHMEVDVLDMDRMDRDFDNGVIFVADIPEGYGLGSSGSVAAAILDKYGVDGNYNMSYTHQLLVAIENFFHGSSSGLDPMVSYYKLPILYAGQKMHITDHLDGKEILSPYILANSGQSRSTKEYVTIFRELKKNQRFLAAYHTIYDLNNLIIKKILHQKTYVQELHLLSKLQYEHMQAMIPDHIKDVWAHGLASGTYDMKLCGAGGGGFFLAREHEKGSIKEHFPDLPTVTIVETE